MSIPKIPKIPMPGHFIGQMSSNGLQVGMNPEAFQKLIEGKGVYMQISRPVPCPNIKDLHTGDHDPSCDRCHNGMMYFGDKTFIGTFMGNNIQRQFEIQGQFDSEQVTIAVPTQAADGSDLDVQLFDQITLMDGNPVRYYQRVEANQSGIDRLQFPAISIEVIIDSTGNQYVADVDFTVYDGNVKWISTNRPGYDLTIEKGIIYSISYYCRPLFTVISLPHQFRTTQALGAEGKPYAQRYPSLAVCRKDFVPYRTSTRTDYPPPRNGSF